MTRASVVAAMGVGLSSPTATDGCDEVPEQQQQQPRASAAVLRTRVRLRPILKSHARLAATVAKRTAEVAESPRACSPSSAALSSSDTESVAEECPTHRRRRVRFDTDAKTWDGVRLQRSIFDTIVTSYFEGSTRRCHSMLAAVATNNMAMMPNLIRMCQDLANRIVQRNSAPVLPHGGGSAARLAREHLVPLLMLLGMMKEVVTLASSSPPPVSVPPPPAAMVMSAPAGGDDVDLFDLDMDLDDMPAFTCRDLSLDVLLADAPVTM